MKLGISINSTYRSDARTAVTRIVERVRAAERSQLDSLSFGDHHVQPGYMQNTPVLGRAVADWGDRPAGCLFLLPLWNPVIVAEHVVTLSGMVSGPFLLQTGIGSGARQFAAMNAEMSTRGRMLDEAIRVIKALLAGETVESEPFGVSGASIEPGPAVDVEWWIGAGNAPAALRRAARVGDVWYAPPGLTPRAAPEPLAIYRDACESEGTTPRICLRKDVLILDDDAEAARKADDLVARGYRGMAREHVVAGDAEHVADQLGEYAVHGVEQIVIRCMAADQAVALDTIDGAAEVRRLLATI